MLPNAMAVLHPGVRRYLGEVANLDSVSGLILFGSAGRGSFSGKSSDVDIILIVPDHATSQQKILLRHEVRRLEIAHGFQPARTRPKNWLEKFAERAGGHANACFICTRADLLSGDVGRLFALRPVEKFFVDRIVHASVLVSAVTMHGEDLLPQVPLPVIRRLDVFKALFNLANLALLSLEAFAVLPDATIYAMGALKHSLHSCYFCYRMKNAPLSEEIEFFGPAFARSRAVVELLTLRQQYRRSFPFVLRCVPAIVRLHLRTARQNRFPRRPVR